MPLAAAQRRRVLTCPMAVLARGGIHGVTPFFDDRRRPEPDLSAAAPPNRWRNPGDRQLWRLSRAAWRLGEKAPASLLALRKALLDAAARDPASQRKALAAFGQAVAGVLQDVARCGAAPPAVAAATADLRE
jgi:hypothetical protein